MENFDLMNEICGKIAQVAIEIGEMDLKISKLQDKGYKESARLYTDMQLTQLDQLHQLTLFLTGLLIPDSDEKTNAKEADEVSEEIEDKDREEKIPATAKRVPPETNYHPFGNPVGSKNSIERRYSNDKPVSRKAGYSNGKYSK